MTFALPDYLTTTAQAIEGRLEASLAKIARDAAPKLREAMAYSLLAGGKRLRPVLVHASCAALGRTATEAELDFASGLEMVHTYSLIHDDLPAMDDDDLRRGRPTSHKVFGEALAILAGDALLTDAFTLLAVGDGDPVHRLALVALLGQAAGGHGMVSGQVLDVAGESQSLTELEQVHARKTGALIRAACRGPALQPGQSPEALSALTSYGEKLGVAFQIADDVLDATGTAAQLGKQAGKDAAKGRVGYPALLGVSGARAAAQAAADAAIAALANLPGDTVPLAALARYTVQRDR